MDQWVAQLTQQLPAVQRLKAQAVAQLVMETPEVQVLEVLPAQILLAVVAADRVRLARVASLQIQQVVTAAQD